MRLTDTILVALQASMGLALVLPHDSMKKVVTQHKNNDADPDKIKYHGYETITKITSHRYFGVKDHKHHHGDDEDDDTDDDDDHKKHHSLDFKKKKKHDEEDDDKDEDEDKDENKNKNKKEKPKLVFPTKEFKEAKKKHEEEFPQLKDHVSETPKSNDKSKSLEDAVEKIEKETKQKFPFENIVLETPKRYNKHKNEEKQVKEDKKERTNSKDGKMYKLIHRNGMDVKRDIDINIHAPTYKIYHNSDKKHDHGDAELIKIFHVSSEESTHESKHHKYKHDGEQKHKEQTKEPHSLPKSHHKHVESKNHDSHDKGHFGSEKKYLQSSKGRNQTQGRRPKPAVKVTKKILELIRPLLKKEDDSHDSSKKPSHQYKSYPSHAYSDKGSPSPHDNRYPDNQNTHHGDKPKNGHGKSDQAENKRIKEKKKNDALRRIIESLADLLAKNEASKHRPKKTHPSQDDHDSHHESDKKHHSHKRPPYPYKEHAEYKHDDNKSHVKLSQDSSSHYEPGYNHEDSKKGQYSHNKPISQYEKKINNKHDDEKNYIKEIKDRVSQYKPTLHNEKPDHHHRHDKDNEHPKRPEPHHKHQEAENHGDSRKSEDYYPYNKPKYQFEEQSKHKHDDDNKRGPFDQRVTMDRKPVDYFTKSGHHKDLENETKAYKDHQSRLETHAKRSSNPVPKLNTTQILNLEALSPQDRKRIAMGLPLDSQTRKEFGEFKECTPKLITKLNVMYARIVDDPKYAPFIKYLNTERKFHNRKRSDSVLTPEMLAKIEAMPPPMRTLAADQLDFSPELKKEFVKGGKLPPSLIEKLKKEYERIAKDPKYKKILDKLKSRRKRATSTSTLTPEMLAKIEAMPPLARTLAADQLDFGPELKKEFVKGGKLSPGLIKKLEKEYERIAKNPKYTKILEKLKSNGKRAAPNPPPPKIPNETLKKIEAMDPILRRFLAEKLNLPAKLTDEFVDCGKLDQAMIDKLNWEYARIHKDPEYKKILQEFNTKSKRSKGQDENTKDEPITLTDGEKEKEAKPNEKEAKPREKEAKPKEKEAKPREKEAKPKEKDSEEPQRLTTAQLSVLANMPKAHRRKIAKKIGLPQKLTRWFVKAKKFEGKNLERLNEEWIRVQLDPKYEDVVTSLKHMALKGNNKASKDKIRKRSVHQLTEKELERVLKLDKYERQALARRLGLDQSLAREFINASKPNTDLLEKLNEAVSKSVGTPQYQELLKLVGKDSPKSNNEELKLESIKKEVRLEIAKSLEFDEFTRDEFLEARELKGRLLDKVTKYWGVKRMENAEQGKDDIKHSEVINKLLGSALDKAGQPGDGLQSKDTDGKKLTEAEQKMKDKLEKTKANGWCDEFVSELEDAWGPKKEKDGN